MAKETDYAYPAINDQDTYAQFGLTKREYFSGLAMQGLLANTIYHNPNERAKMITVSALVETAVNYADALLEELEKTQP